MPRFNTFLTIICLVIITVLLGYNYFFQPFKDWTPPVTELKLESLPPEPLNQEAIILAATLTPRQKITQLMAVPIDIPSTTPRSTQSAILTPATQAWMASEQPGWVTLFGQRVTRFQADKAVTEIKNSAKVAELPPLIAVDHEGGTVQRLNGQGWTVLPSWQSVCSQPASQSAQLLEQSATELADSGVNVILGPVVDFAERNAVLQGRICSDNPLTVAERSGEAVQIFQKHNLLPVIKHFPGIGSTSRDLHTSFDRVTVTAADAIFYRELLTQLPGVAVMVSHAGVTNQYPDIPCSLSVACVGELKNNFPTTILITDALEMNSARYVGTSTELASLPQVSYQALKAGNDVLLYGAKVSPAELTEIVDTLVTYYESDVAFKDRVETSLLKIITLKLQQP